MVAQIGNGFLKYVSGRCSDLIELAGMHSDSLVVLDGGLPGFGEKIIGEIDRIGFGFGVGEMGEDIAAESEHMDVMFMVPFHHGNGVLDIGEGGFLGTFYRERVADHTAGTKNIIFTQDGIDAAQSEVDAAVAEGVFNNYFTLHGVISL